MAKNKITSNDFMRLMEDEAASHQHVAFAPSMSSKVETNRGQSRDKVGTQPETLLETKWRQTEDKVETNCEFSSLIGLQRKLIIFLYQSCKAARSSSTESLSIEHIAKSCETSVGSTKKTLQRLENKKFFKRIKFKDGRGGWTVYELQSRVFQDLLRAETEDKVGTNWRQTGDKVGTQLETQPRTSPSCSSSNLNLNNTTTTQAVDSADLWLSVPKNLEGRVSIKQLRDFVKQGLISAEDLQSSLDGFAYDLEKGSIRAKNGNPVAILIGAVKSGGYISQSYLSELRASLSDVAKAREEMQQIQAANSTQQLQEEFESFRGKFPDQAEQMKPMNKYLTNFELGSVGYEMWLEKYRKTSREEQGTQTSEVQA